MDTIRGEIEYRIGKCKILCKDFEDLLNKSTYNYASLQEAVKGGRKEAVQVMLEIISGMNKEISTAASWEVYVEIKSRIQSWLEKEGLK
jgi:sugar-specific transcriptional regulator TrmB